MEECERRKDTRHRGKVFVSLTANLGAQSGQQVALREESKKHYTERVTVRLHHTISQRHGVHDEINERENVN